MVKNMSRQFIGQETQMADKCMKSSSAVYVVREMRNLVRR